MKLTKRKGFNFFRSYFDVYNELETDKDKLSFIDALLDRQFLGIKPSDLKGLAKFAYISQTNSIDSQVKGYEDKMKVSLNQDINTPTVGGAVGGCDGGKTTPTLQVEEKEKEKEKDIDVRKLTFKNSLWNTYKKEYKVKTLEAFYLYWTEHGDNDKKMRFEKEKSFSVERRLKRWAKNDYDKTEIKESTNNAQMFQS